MNSYIKKLVEAAEKVGNHQKELYDQLATALETVTQLQLENDKLREQAELGRVVEIAFSKKFEMVSMVGSPFTLATNSEQLLEWGKDYE